MTKRAEPCGRTRDPLLRFSRIIIPPPTPPPHFFLYLFLYLAASPLGLRLGGCGAVGEISAPSLSNTRDNVLRLRWKCNKGQRDMPEPPHNNICLPVKGLRNIKARVRGYTGCRDLILAQVKFVSFFTKLQKNISRSSTGLRLDSSFPASYQSALT